MGGGHLLHGHFEMMRNGINRKLNTKKAFAIYRVEAPWFSHTKKAIGHRMGGGMGNISYYSTPVKEKRVILEIAGMVIFEEVCSFSSIFKDHLIYFKNIKIIYLNFFFLVFIFLTLIAYLMSTFHE